ncbi:nicotinate-nucleotide--dimethylbenzimidazole phosphoribosyltransferase [Alphaproteobacteria bacterium 46_93_T64]|nr:nicotinate-nucleotide--dimethylbenzimidazole phosphoribosyltransferase [Alphaproteobacteria bacterium 46_93_T64]
MSIKNLQDFREKLSQLPLLNSSSEQTAVERNAQLTKPAGSLGTLEDLAIWAAAWQGQHPASFNSPQIVIFAGNHGVCGQGISAFPPEVTVQMVANFEHGGAAINQLAKAFGARFSVHPLQLDTPTADFTTAPALSEDELLTALNVGWNSVREDADFLVVGEMGIGNTTVAAALCSALFGGKGKDWAGPGTGVTEEGISKKAEVIDQGLDLHREILNDPIEILRCLGGRELAAMAGAVLAARYQSIPVILDGFVTCAAAAVLAKANPTALDHCVAGHVSAEPGHVHLLQKLKKKPLLDLGMRLGEGSGAALALGILKGAIATHSGMATFAEAGVSDKD